jgi:hypothetical protein
MVITCSLFLYALDTFQLLPQMHGVCTYNTKRPRHRLRGLWNFEFYLHAKHSLFTLATVIRLGACAFHSKQQSNGSRGVNVKCFPSKVLISEGTLAGLNKTELNSIHHIFQTHACCLLPAVNYKSENSKVLCMWIAV